MNLTILVVAGLLTGTSFFSGPDDRDGTGAPTGAPAGSSVTATPSAESARDARWARCREQDPTGWETSLAPEAEPGEKLVVDGRVLARDRVTPVRGAKVYVFHTDAAGFYSEHHGMDNANPRLCGIVRTDDQGRYRITTIRPGRYATGGPSPHVHYEVTPPGAARSRPFVLALEPETRSHVAKATEPWATSRPIVRDERGAWHCTRDLWLQ